jgi:hypothetical protein
MGCKILICHLDRLIVVNKVNLCALSPEEFILRKPEHAIKLISRICCISSPKSRELKENITLDRSPIQQLEVRPAITEKYRQIAVGSMDGVAAAGIIVAITVSQEFVK